jgi:hypothetical protein
VRSMGEQTERMGTATVGMDEGGSVSGSVEISFDGQTPR